jgi:hypothetical protein
LAASPYPAACQINAWYLAMKIQLSMRGGIYGSVEFEPIEPNVLDPGFGDEVLAVLNEFASSTRSRSGNEKPTEPDVRTERQTIFFKVVPDEGKPEFFSIDETSLDAHPRLKRLFDILWKHSRPQPSE